ncbi:MAG: DUF3349 domain-containing protein [Oscillatoriales cyanobacterium RU_3_3]|nr:DUF3349 domain-containing protein [Microcoleus sp. SU_5_6]NJL66647.1 DUF3349 domain-containing protein [Microcoleus sp. SM1_3_4]NJM62932.1 DUF3349 domain-containing protein [Oscillatoriales cyanobacterium RU_3_3]NJR22320.1 DUF3349 domain-containing protein [Richelia sp. CSU_2_1]
MKVIENYLLSTYKLIERAFPDGVKEEDYLPLLTLLYDEMSDRNLAEVMAHCTGKDYYLVLNDVYAVSSIVARDTEAIAKLNEHLLSCGYAEWLAE